jgi:hypothetical protein
MLSGEPLYRFLWLPTEITFLAVAGGETVPESGPSLPAANKIVMPSRPL